MRMIVPFLMLPDNIYLQKMGDCLQRGAGDDRQPENAEPFGVAPNGFLLDGLGFRLLLGCYEC